MSERYFEIEGAHERERARERQRQGKRAGDRETNSVRDIKTESATAEQK